MAKAPDALFGASSARRYLLMQIAVWLAFARASRHSERVLYAVPWPPSDVTRLNLAIPPAAGSSDDAGAASSLLTQMAVPVAFARASKHSERVLYGVPWPPSDVTR